MSRRWNRERTSGRSQEWTRTCASYWCSSASSQPSLAGSSTTAPKILKVAAGKRPVSDIIANDRSRKKVRATNNVGIPPALTPEKREPTFLFVLLPCSSSEMVLVKLRSTMTLPTLFSSVCAAAGIIEHERLAIAVMFEREGSGQGKTSS